MRVAIHFCIKKPSLQTTQNFTLVCLWYGQTVGWAGRRLVYSHMIAKFSRLGSLPHFLIHGAPLHVLRKQELPYEKCERTNRDTWIA